MTGEPDDIKKTKDDDCFLLSSCLVTTIDGGSNCKAVVIGIGIFSQWGKIKANLVTESVNTPLQDKLETMTKQVIIVSFCFDLNYYYLPLYQIGYLGFGVAIGTFIALIISIWTRDGGHDVAVR